MYMYCLQSMLMRWLTWPPTCRNPCCALSPSKNQQSTIPLSVLSATLTIDPITTEWVSRPSITFSAPCNYNHWAWITCLYATVLGRIWLLLVKLLDNTNGRWLASRYVMCPHSLTLRMKQYVTCTLSCVCCIVPNCLHVLPLSSTDFSCVQYLMRPSMKPGRLSGLRMVPSRASCF